MSNPRLAGLPRQIGLGPGAFRFEGLPALDSQVVQGSNIFQVLRVWVFATRGCRSWRPKGTLGCGPWTRGAASGLGLGIFLRLRTLMSPESGFCGRAWWCSSSARSRAQDRISFRTLAQQAATDRSTKGFLGSLRNSQAFILPSPTRSRCFGKFWPF